MASGQRVVPSRVSASLLFGLGSVLAMSLSIGVAPGINVSARNIPVTLAGVIGAPVAACITVAMTVTYRIWQGGDGVLVGVLGAITAGLIGVASGILRTIFQTVHVALYLAGTGIIVVTVGMLLLAMLGNASLSLAMELALPLYLVVPAGMAVVGLALLSEDNRLELQFKLREQTALFEAIFNSMSDGVTVANDKGEIILVNPASLASAGVPPTDAPSDEWASRFGVF